MQAILPRLDELTPYALLALGAAGILRSIPDLVKAWRKRSDAESDLIIQALADVKALRKELHAAESRIDQLETEVAQEKAARSHADGQIEVFRMQLDRSMAEQELWEKRARALWTQVDDLYRAVSSSEQGKSLPPAPQKDW